jgi:hypothetical protein
MGAWQLTRLLHVKTISAEQLGLEAFVSTHSTLVEDAEAKALAVARATQRAALADCAVLCIPALSNAPGLNTARYSRTHPSRAWPGPAGWLGVAKRAIGSAVMMRLTLVRAYALVYSPLRGLSCSSVRL